MCFPQVLNLTLSYHVISYLFLSYLDAVDVKIYKTRFIAGAGSDDVCVLQNAVDLMVDCTKKCQLLLPLQKTAVLHTSSGKETLCYAYKH